MSLNDYQQYKAQSINTMTKGEMLLLLFDELVKRLTRAEIALKNHDDALFNQSVERATDIVRYLKRTLNHQYPISRELRSLYDFFIYELSRIKASRNQKVIQELKPLVEDLRVAFHEAAKQTNI